MITKYGIKYVLTNEWVVCQNDSKSEYLFTADKEKIKVALSNILFSDGGYDGEVKDFKIEKIELPEEYDGSDLIKDDVYFIKPEVVKNDLTTKQIKEE